MGAIGQLTVPLIWTKCIVSDKGAMVIDPEDIDRVTPLVVKTDRNLRGPVDLMPKIAAVQGKR